MILRRRLVLQNYVKQMPKFNRRSVMIEDIDHGWWKKEVPLGGFILSWMRKSWKTEARFQGHLAKANLSGESDPTEDVVDGDVDNETLKKKLKKRERRQEKVKIVVVSRSNYQSKYVHIHAPTSIYTYTLQHIPQYIYVDSLDLVLCNMLSARQSTCTQFIGQFLRQQGIDFTNTLFINGYMCSCAKSHCK